MYGMVVLRGVACVRNRKKKVVVEEIEGRQTRTRATVTHCGR